MALSKLKITTCLWFDGQAEEAANFYTSIFSNSKFLSAHPHLEAGKEIHGQDPGTAMIVEFDLDGHRFVDLNGGPKYNFNEAVSFQIDCANQEEVDYYWGKLGEGGDPGKQQCGWVADKFGVSWQVVPTALKAMLGDKDLEAAGRAAEAMM
ncbi:3-demethylubiquinone-9 3-methyltransferase-domain-containing protein [Chaetomidium leptoderma]|uniref:3-demethylubiquinone-9 3-methyltransferase-domain-containing protein n=1 Tax=Chaetomidium leptoderma TaxID=669021 RepID=A0AAN6VHV9_9PEZI|nr:3-demethylubiquinone-9 3-methyltransferase-domain-containing protein [Chaetomidium leptoderma]